MLETGKPESVNG